MTLRRQSASWRQLELRKLISATATDPAFRTLYAGDRILGIIDSA